MNNINENPKSTKSQSAAILAHLQTGASITPIEALEMFQCFRLSGRIYDLRADSHQIIRQMVQRNGKRFAEYRLKTEE